MKFPKLGPGATIVLVIIVVALLVFVVWVAAAYNGLVSKQVAAQTQWQQVENQIQRKVDLIPQLVLISRNYTQFEQNLLTNLTALQVAWQNASGIPAQMNISNLISLTLASWVQTFVNFPDLHAIEVVQSLFDEVTGTENRIAFERLRYNDRVQSYNTSIRTFPNVIVAGWFGFQPAPFFDPIPGGP